MRGNPRLPSAGDPRDPHGPDEWQEAVDLANAMLTVDACRQYGLIEWDGVVDVARCEEILRRARRHNIVRPRPAAEVILELLR